MLIRTKYQTVILDEMLAVSRKYMVSQNKVVLFIKKKVDVTTFIWQIESVLYLLTAIANKDGPNLFCVAYVRV